MRPQDNAFAVYKYSGYTFFKSLCKVARFTCFEDFWYETKESGRCICIGYIILSLYYFTALGNELMEVFLNTYPKDLHRDAILFSMAHIIILFRIYFFSYKRREIRELIKEIVDSCREYEDEQTNRKQYKKMKLSLVFYASAFYSAAVSVLGDGLRKYFLEGQPLVIISGYWPKYEDVTIIGVIFKVNMFAFILIQTATLLSKDSLAIVKLIILSYKFITLRRYFENLHDDFDNSVITITELKNKCLKGIEMHRELLRITEKFRKLYNLVLSIVVFQGCAVVILVMLKVTFTPDLTFTFIIMSMSYMMALIGPLALFMWNAGEITHQASLLPTAIFHCGWHLRPVNCEHSRSIRRLVLMGCLQAQRPLVLKAFGLQDISYRSFVSVVQTSYSIFAVFRQAK